MKYSIKELDTLFWNIKGEEPPFIMASEAAAICNADVKPFIMFSVSGKGEQIRREIEPKDILTAARIGFSLGALAAHEGGLHDVLNDFITDHTNNG